jgi:geranylgeranyl diphosphate synthase, type II
MISFQAQYAAYQAAVDQALPLYFGQQTAEEGGQPLAAGLYSLTGGGKRVRPVLLLAVCDLLGYPCRQALPYACALELIHTYSLIHDDLPAMDNDDLRRGRPTCHKVFGEATAILAGDALLNRAYEILLDAIPASGSERGLHAARQIAAAAGSRGMIGGQALDLAAAGKSIDAEQLRRMHQLKTGALLKAPVLAATSLAAAEPAVCDMLAEFADAIGLAFQIKDDILDVTADEAMLGKSAGKDRRDGKPTYVSLFGLAEAGRQLEATLAQARNALARMAEQGLAVTFLAGLAEYLLERTS